jgi:RimJ/RimL family protein N-acetyltransferase
MASALRPELAKSDAFLIRGWAERDGAALYEAVDSSREHLRSMSWIRDVGSVAAGRDYVCKSRAWFLLDNDFDLAIWTPDERRVLGGTGFHPRGAKVLPARTADISMWIREDAAGRGLGSAVLRELLRWGFADWEWMRLTWHCDASNLASVRCAEKAGMLREGTLRGEYDETTQGRRDTACFGLCRVDYEAGRLCRS